MSRPARRTIMLLPILALLAACQTSIATPSSASAGVTPAEIDFVTNASAIISFDRDECGLAQAQAKSPEVRAIAAKLLADANQFDEDLRPVAAQSGIKLATILPTTLRNRAARLRLGQGSQFDQSFIADQIASHQDALNLTESVIGTPSSNPSLAALSKQGDALVRANLEQLLALQRRMNRAA